MKVSGYRFAIWLVVAAAIAVTPMYATAIVQGALFQNLDDTNYMTGADIYSTPAQTGSPVSDVIAWSYTCTTCSGYGFSGSGAAKVINGSLGASSSVTVTGSPVANYLGEANSYSQYDDSLTMTGGTGTGVLEFQYTVDGVVSHTGTGYNVSTAYLAMYGPGIFYQLDNGAITSGNEADFSGDGTKSDTVNFYIPFTYGTPVSIEPIMRSAANFYTSVDSTPYTATWDYYNTATLNSALVFDGTPQSLGAQNTTAVIGSTSGLGYGPKGASATPEPGTWLLVASALGVVFFLKKRGATSTR